MASLVDVNFLVALVHEGHPHSVRAVKWMETQDAISSIKLCRVAQMGALRVLTNTKAMATEVFSAAEFWVQWTRLLEDDRFAEVSEPSNFASTWREITSAFPKGKCAETDAYLAAFALANGWSVVTFDQGFRQFSELNATIL